MHNPLMAPALPGCSQFCQIAWAGGKSGRGRLLLAAVLLVAGLGYFFGWSAAPFRAQDTASYQAVAQDIHGLVFSDLRDRTPGYPLLLLCTGSSVRLTRLLFAVSLALHFASVGLLFGLLLRTGLPRWLSGVFLALSLTPLYVAPAAVALTEVLTRFLVTFGAVQTIRGVSRGSAWRFAAAGVSFGYAGWTHPLFLAAFCPVVAGLWILRCVFHWSPVSLRRLLLGSGWIVGAGVGALCALFVFNSCAYGFKGISPFGGIALSSKTARFVEKLPRRYGEIRDVLIESRNRALVEGKSHMAGSYIWNARPSLMRATGLKAQELDALLKRANLELIEGSPIMYLNEVGYSWVGFWTPGGSDLASSKSRALGVLWVVVDLVVNGGWAFSAVTLGSTALLMRFRRFRGAVSRAGLAGASRFSLGVHLQVVAASLICWTALAASAFGIGDSRYRRPVDLLLLACAVHGLGTLLTLLKTKPESGKLKPESGKLKTEG